MILKKRILAFLFIVFINASTAYSQTKDSSSNKVSLPAKSYFKFSTAYKSNAVWEGRKDSGVISYITPEITYVNKSGWNVAGSLSYSPNAEVKQIDLITLEAGYEHEIDSVFTVNFSTSAFFYNPYSVAVNSESSGFIGAGVQYSPKDIITASATIDVALSTKPDIVTNLVLSHPFYFGDTGHDWSFAPTASLFAGTQNYYQNYYTNRKFNQTVRLHGKGRGRNNGTTTSNATTVNIVSKSSYAILDYELSCPLTFDATKWGLFATPTYAIPVHPITYNEGGTNITEQLSNTFYFEAGAYVKF